MGGKEAEFIERVTCINCGSRSLKELSGGFFGENPLRQFINNDPWGKNPLSYIENKRWGYVRCENCTQMFHRYILSPEWNERRFSEWMTQEAMEKFGESSNTPAHHFARAKQYVSHILRVEKMTAKLRHHEAVRILDFGCGWGEFLAMCDRFGFKGYGIDRSPARRHQGQYASIFPEITDLRNIPEAADGFHVVTLFEVLEHIEAPGEILQSIKNQLVPGGILICETPDCTNVENISTQREYRMIHPLDHINAFTPKTLRSICERAGFRAIKPVVSHATSSGNAFIKNEIKRLFDGFLKAKTQMYFQKT